MPIASRGHWYRLQTCGRQPATQDLCGTNLRTFLASESRRVLLDQVAQAVERAWRAGAGGRLRDELPANRAEPSRRRSSAAHWAAAHRWLCRPGTFKGKDTDGSWHRAHETCQLFIAAYFLKAAEFFRAADASRSGIGADMLYLDASRVSMRQLLTVNIYSHGVFVSSILQILRDLHTSGENKAATAASTGMLPVKRSFPYQPLANPFGASRSLSRRFLVIRDCLSHAVFISLSLSRSVRRKRAGAGWG